MERVQREISGGVVFLECEDNPVLLVRVVFRKLMQMQDMSGEKDISCIFCFGERGY